MICHIYLHLNLYLKDIRTKLLDDWVDVFVEDIDVVERMQRGRASEAFDGGVLTPYHDGPTRRFMALVERAL